ncbi:MAG TPA: GntR family transcriptional regulator [Mesorhizobium sp.]|uniref:GntR family transcriptional regulator n=1 Tax=Mesorhizobium sp. TaxID=1871066 RepID=UPI002DDCA129|nr:GntR family transcriptional regulator [Mesorhizobium sp.]HEV2501812.1 GntR family transcriptional regulator [Mesorhizobium sp.]
MSAEAEAYEYILGKIRRGELRPGMRLKSEDVASEIGMSRMPVREAFGRLYQLGILTLRANRGAVVTEFTPEQLMEVFEIRSVLEGLAMRRATIHATDKDIEELHDLLERMRRVEEDVEQWLTRHTDFHKAIARLSKAQRLAGDIEKTQLLLEIYMRLWVLHAEKPVDLTGDHLRLIEAIAAGNPGEAEAVMRDHVLNTAPAVVEFLSKHNAFG